MGRLFREHELWFSLVMITVYSIMESLALTGNQLINRLSGVRYVGSAVITVVIAAVLYGFIRRNHLAGYYGFRRLQVSGRTFLYFIPMAIIVSINLWNGAVVNLGFADSLFFLLYMLSIGFVEETLFRGFLFKTVSKSNLTAAVLITSMTFGMDHFLNLINGSGMSFLTVLCQVTEAAAVGFLFVFVLVRSGSIIPCIASHFAIDMISLFANGEGLNDEKRMIFGLARIAVVIIYILIINRIDRASESGTGQHAVSAISAGGKQNDEWIP